jgi:hypothetical protein
MTTHHLKSRTDPTLEELCVSNTPLTIENDQNNNSIMNQPLSQTFKELSVFMMSYAYIIKISKKYSMTCGRNHTSSFHNNAMKNRTDSAQVIKCSTADYV